MVVGTLTAANPVLVHISDTWSTCSPASGAVGRGHPGYRVRVRGDRVEVVIDAGDEVRTYEIVATRNGRRVEVETGRGIVTVSEVTRGGTAVRTARFMANRILALVEHPAAEQNIAREDIGAESPTHR